MLEGVSHLAQSSKDKIKSQVFSILLIGPIFYSFHPHSLLKPLKFCCILFNQIYSTNKNWIKLYQAQTMEKIANNNNLCTVQPFIVFKPFSYSSSFFRLTRTFQIKKRIWTLYDRSFKWYCWGKMLIFFFSLNFNDLHTLEEAEGKRAWVPTKSNNWGAREGIHFRCPQSLQDTGDEKDG